MSWGRQVVHVAWKDLQEARWFVVAYVLGIGAMAASIAAWPHLAGPPSLGVLLVTVLFLLVVAAFVQSDSPSRLDAFWVTRPLSPSAVAAAKVLAAVMGLIVPGLVAQAVITSVYGLAPANILHAVVGQLGTEAFVLVLALPVAALTRDLRTFVLAVVVLLVGGQCAGQLRETHVASIEVAPVATGIVRAAWLLLALGLYLHQYRTRNVRRGWVGGIALSALFIASPRFTGVVAAPASAGSARVAIDSVRIPAHAGWAPSLFLWYGAEGRQPDERLVAGVVGVRIQTVDGTPDSVYTVHVPVVDEPPLSLAPYDWIGVDRGLRFATRASEIRLSDQQLADIAAGRLVVRVRATVLVQRPIVAATLPLEVGATARLAGARIQFRGVQETRDGLTMKISTLIVNNRPALRAGTGAFSYALVNDARGEAIQLSDASSSGSVVGLSATSMSVFFQRQELRAGRDRRVEASPWLDAAWLRGAHLIVVQWRDRFSGQLDQQIDSASIRALHRATRSGPTSAHELAPLPAKE